MLAPALLVSTLALGLAPTPVEIIVVPLKARGVDDAVAADATRAVVAGLSARAVVLGDDELAARLDDAQRAELATCERGACFATLAEAAHVDAIVFGTVEDRGGERPIVLEVRVVEREAGRVTAKAAVDGPDAASVMALAPDLARDLALPSREPPPPPEPPKKRDLFEDPVFIAGVAVTFVGAMAIATGSAYAFQADQFLGDPGKARALKSDALFYGPWALVVAGVGAGVVAVGLGTMGVGYLLTGVE